MISLELLVICTLFLCMRGLEISSCILEVLVDDCDLCAEIGYLQVFPHFLDVSIDQAI